MLSKPEARARVLLCQWCRPYILMSMQMLVIAGIVVLTCFEVQFPTVLGARRDVIDILTMEEGCSMPFLFSIASTVLLEIMQVRRGKIADIGLLLFTLLQSVFMIVTTVHYYRHWNEGVPLCCVLTTAFCLVSLGSVFEKMVATYSRFCWLAFGLLSVGFFLASQIWTTYSVWRPFIGLPIGIFITLGVVLESSCQGISLSGGATCVINSVYLAWARRFLVLVLQVPYGKDGDAIDTEGSGGGDADTIVHLPPPSPPSSPRRGRDQSHFELNCDLHNKIPPSHWCVTKKDVQQFVADVKQAWLKGEIPNSDPKNPHHDNPQIGPSMYQVTEHFIKPTTLARGGCSYALMMHPQGSPTPCDLFVTHAWAEGIFEFGNKLLNNWPAGTTYLWCCFLANPQNGDIANLIGDVLESPFAKALESAKKMIVLPNCSVSIYERMWCVLEAKLAMERQIDIIIPTAATNRRLLRATIRGCALLLVGALMSVIALALVCPAPVVSTMMLLMISHSMVTLGKRLLTQSFQDICCSAQDARALLLGFLSGGGFQWLLTERLACNSSVVSSLRSVAWAIICTVPLGIEWTLRRFRRDILAKEALQLEFTSVRDARCANEKDRLKIAAAMEGQEDQIDGMINNLRAIGEFNARVRTELALGCDPSNRHYLSWTLFGSVCVLLGVCFSGNAAEVCGPRGFSGPPTLFGYWESLLPYLPGSTFSKEPAAILVFTSMFSISALAYAVTRVPRYYHTAMFIEVFGIVMYVYVFTCLLSEKVQDFLFGHTWSELYARRMAYFKVFSYLGAMLSGQIFILVWSPCVHASFVLRTSSFLHPFITVALGVLAAGFEGCVGDCSLHRGYEECIQGCAFPSWNALAVVVGVILPMSIVGAYVLRSFSRKPEGKSTDDGDGRGIEMQAFDRIQHARITVGQLSDVLAGRNSDTSSATIESSGNDIWSNEHGIRPKLAKRYWTVVVCFCIILSSGILGGWVIMPHRSVSFNRYIVRGKTTTVVLSGDNLRAVLAQDTLVSIVAMSTGRVLHILRGHTSRVTSVAISVDSSRVLTGSLDGTARLWDTSNGNPVYTFTNFVLATRRKSCVHAVALNRDFTKLLIAGSREHVQMFDITTRECTWKGFANQSGRAFFKEFVSFLAFAGGNTFITGSQRYQESTDPLLLWEVSVKKVQVIHTFSAIEGVFQTAAISGDSTKLIAAINVNSKFRLQLWDIQSRKVSMDIGLHDVTPHGFSCIALSHNGSQAVLGTNQTSAPNDRRDIVSEPIEHPNVAQSLHILDTSTGTLVDTYTHKGTPLALAISANDEILATGSDDSVVYFYLMEYRTIMSRFHGHASMVQSVAVSADGDYALSRNSNGECILWEVRSGDVKMRIEGEHQSLAYDAQFSLVAHGHELFFTPLKHGERAADPKIFDRHSSDELVRYIGVSYDGNKAFAIYAREALLYDCVSGKVTRTFVGSDKDGDFTVGQISKDNELFYAGTEHGTSILWNVETGDRAHEFPYSGCNCTDIDVGEFAGRQHWFRPVRAAKFSWDRSLLIVGHGPSAVTSMKTAATIWNVKTGKARNICGNIGGVRAVSFSRDDSLMLIGPLWGELTLYATRTGKILKRYFSRKQHLDATMSKEMVISSSEGGFIVWHRRTGMLLYTHRETRENQLGWLDGRT